MERNLYNFDVLSKFFLDRSFARVAVAAIGTTTLPPDMHPAASVMGMLQERIARVARLLPCTAVIVVVESSQRADPILRQRFGELKPDGAELAMPIEYCLMPKSAGEPGLEVADFIINAAGSQTQRFMRGEDGLTPDFTDVFCRLPPEGCQFCLIRSFDGNRENGLVRVQGLCLTGNTLSPLLNSNQYFSGFELGAEPHKPMIANFSRF